jgi:hypothetical protein
MNATLTLRRLIDAVDHLALMAYPGEYQQLRMIERIYRTCVDRPVDPFMEEYAAFLCELELQWLVDYQRDQDIFLRGTTTLNIGPAAPGCEDKMDALLGENVDVALNGALAIGALYGVHYEVADRRRIMKWRDPCSSLKPVQAWTVVRRRGQVKTTQDLDETSHPFDQNGRDQVIPELESDFESEQVTEEVPRTWYHMRTGDLRRST